MAKMTNIFLLILTVIFFSSSYKYYLSNKNSESKIYNRNNIDKIINTKISNIPILENDTNNVIKFNDGFSNETFNDKPRSFWNLLKSK